MLLPAIADKAGWQHSTAASHLLPHCSEVLQKSMSCLSALWFNTIRSAG